MIKIRNEQGLKNSNKMICFPYAGGCASFYSKWGNELEEIDICPIQLPGREECFREDKIYDMEIAVGQILEKIEDFVDVNTIFLGIVWVQRWRMKLSEVWRKKAKKFDVLSLLAVVPLIYYPRK